MIRRTMIASLDGDEIIEGLVSGVDSELARRLGVTIKRVTDTIDTMDKNEPSKGGLEQTSLLLQDLDFIIENAESFTDPDAASKIQLLRKVVDRMRDMCVKKVMN